VTVVGYVICGKKGKQGDGRWICGAIKGGCSRGTSRVGRQRYGHTCHMIWWPTLHDKKEPLLLMVVISLFLSFDFRAFFFLISYFCMPWKVE